MPENILYVLIIIFIAATDWLRRKYSKKISLMYDVAYITSLQRTLFLCKYILEILYSLGKTKINSKGILAILKTKGLDKFIKDDVLYFCPNTYFTFKPTDNINCFIDTFSKTIQQIEKELLLYWNNEKTPFKSFLDFNPSPFSYDTRFLPPKTIKEMSYVVKDDD